MPAEAVDVRTAGLPWKAVVVGIVLKRNPIRIMTQTRIVQNLAYDPNSHMTQEAVGETIKPGELPITALLRGLAEECGNANCIINIYGDSSTPYTTGKKLFGVPDLVRSYKLYRLTVIETHPQPWFAAIFLVEVTEEWQPNLKKADGEEGKATWWKPLNLRDALYTNPRNFHILHFPAYCELVEDIIGGRLTL